MLKKYLLLTLFISLIACGKDEVDESQNKKMSLVNNNTFVGYWGEFMPENILIQVQSFKQGDQNLYEIKSNFLQGNGFIEKVFLSSEDQENGLNAYSVSLGCTNNQKISFSLYERSTQNLIDSITININATQPKGWCKACGIKDVYKQFRFYNEIFYTIYASNLYYSEDYGINWIKFEGFNLDYEIYDLQFTSNGLAFIITQNNGVFKSADLVNWENISIGINDFRNPNMFLVEDSNIFAGFSFDGIYRTSNEGDSWDKLAFTNFENNEILITRHPNGSLFIVDKSDYFMVSTNNGNSWDFLNIQPQLNFAHVADIEIDQNGLLYVGDEYNASISIMTTDTYSVIEKHSFFEANSYVQKVNNIEIINNIVYFSVIGNPKPGLYSSENGWGKLNLGFDDTIFSYYKKKDNTFLMSGEDRVYYFNK